MTIPCVHGEALQPASGCRAVLSATYKLAPPYWERQGETICILLKESF